MTKLWKVRFSYKVDNHPDWIKERIKQEEKEAEEYFKKTGSRSIGGYGVGYGYPRKDEKVIVMSGDTEQLVSIRSESTALTYVVGKYPPPRFASPEVEIKSITLFTNEDQIPYDYA